MKKIFFVLSVVLFLMALSVFSFAAEKQVSIKGIYIGMPVDKARTIAGKILTGDWKISEIGAADVAHYRFGNEQIFGKKVNESNFRPDSIIGDYGFAIHRYNSYEGFISADKNTKKVTRISFGGEITEVLYGNGKKLDIEAFVKDFTQHFELPDFYWIVGGWYYESPNGYAIAIKTDKLIDIRKTEIIAPTTKPESTKFD